MGRERRLPSFSARSVLWLRVWSQLLRSHPERVDRGDGDGIEEGSSELRSKLWLQHSGLATRRKSLRRQMVAFMRQRSHRPVCRVGSERDGFGDRE